MSYILDALKKSERERDAGIERVSASSPSGAAHAAVPPWVWLTVGMVTAVVAAMAFGLWWFTPTASAPVESAAPVRDLAEQAHIPAPRPVPASPPVSADVPFLRSLPDELRRSLPEMAVNIHVYAPEASRRLLYINNREYHKGEFLGGVLIEDVLPDGVLMNYQGVRFKLERPR